MPSIKEFSELKRHIALPKEWRDSRPSDKSPNDPKDKESFVRVATL
jgi:hypothetical protein